MDLEPGVLKRFHSSEIRNIFNYDNVFYPPNSIGSGNSWANAYYRGKENSEIIFDMISHEMDKSDNLQAFFITHSVCGGTGSGLSSFLFEGLNDKYPKKLLQSFSIFPEPDEIDCGNIQSYNSILGLKRLATSVDAVVVFNNSALRKIVANGLNDNKHGFDQINSLISTVMTSYTNTIRRPGPWNKNLV